MSLLSEFREFAVKGNVVDLAVGVIIGAAFNGIVKSLVDQVVMPPIGLITGGIDFSNLFIDLSGTAPATLAAAKDAGVDKALDAKKKQAEAAEAAQKKAEAEKVAKAKADNCKLARQAKTTFESGIRLARANSAGEREFLDDAARASEMQRIQGVIDADCK